MIATPEQYRTLADLIERGPVVGVVMLGEHMIVARPDFLVRIYKDGLFDRPKFLDAEALQ